MLYYYSLEYQTKAIRNEAIQNNNFDLEIEQGSFSSDWILYVRNNSQI